MSGGMYGQRDDSHAMSEATKAGCRATQRLHHCTMLAAVSEGGAVTLEDDVSLHD